jgi:hypothetical protein
VNIEKGADFEQAFAQFSSPDDKKPAEAPTDGAAPTDEAGEAAAAAGAGDGDGSGAAAAAADGPGADAGDTGGDAAPAGDGAAAEGGEPAAAAEGAEPAAESGEAAAAAAAAPAEAGPSADDILAGLKKLVGEAKPEDKPTEAAPAAETPAAIYSEEETKFLAEYDSEWGDVVKGEALKRRAEYQQLMTYIFEQVANFVKPIQETAETLANRTHATDLTTAVPDYSDRLRDDVVKWVGTQPAYLQSAYNQVITEGTVEEVKDLVDRYRTATGAKQPAGAGGAAKANGKGNELSDEAKKAAASLAPVDSKRSGVQQPSDPSNFDDAWKQFSDSV